MAVLQGMTPQLPMASFTSNVSADLAEQNQQWSPACWDSPGLMVGDVERTLVSGPGFSLAGRRMSSYIEDFYYRIHVAPARLDLGNVASAEVTRVVVWNAFLASRTLADITAEDADGISLDGPAAPALVLPLQLLEYLVSVTTDGPPVVDATFTWSFDGEPPAELRITATRIIPFAFAPDWADGVIERISFLTNVLTSPTGTEQRRALRLSPRRIFEAPVIVDGAVRQYFDMSMWGWSGRTWALPIWPDIQLLAAPLPEGALEVPCLVDGRDFYAGGLALLLGQRPQDAEVVEIEALTGDSLILLRPTQKSWSRGTRLYPVRTARLTSMPEVTRITDQAASAAVSFLVLDPSDWMPDAPDATYRGWPVLSQRPDESEDLTSSMQRLLTELDNQTGIPSRIDVAPHAFTAQRYSWVLSGRAEHTALRALLYFLQGRYKALWVPTFADDMTLLSSVSETETFIRIANIGYTRFAAMAPGRRDIRIELRDGAVFHRRITDSSEMDADIEHLVIDSSFGRIISAGDVSRISWMALCRLDQDDIELKHDTDADGTGSCQVVFRSVRDEL